MTEINIKTRKSSGFSDVETGDFFIFEGVLYCKTSDAAAFCTEDHFRRSFQRDTQIHLVKRIDVILA